MKTKILLSISVLSLLFTGCGFSDNGDGNSSNNGIVDMIQIQADTATTYSINSIHADGDLAVCKISVSTYEFWKSDVDSFYLEDIGSVVDYDTEKSWVDTNSNDIYNIMSDRIDQAAYINCDIILFEDVDIYNFDSGFNISVVDVNQYLDVLISDTHYYNMEVGAFDIDVFDEPLIESKFDIIFY